MYYKPLEQKQSLAVFLLIFVSFVHFLFFIFLRLLILPININYLHFFWVFVSALICFGFILFVTFEYVYCDWVGFFDWFLIWNFNFFSASLALNETWYCILLSFINFLIFTISQLTLNAQPLKTFGFMIFHIFVCNRFLTYFANDSARLTHDNVIFEHQLRHSQIAIATLLYFRPTC